MSPLRLLARPLLAAPFVATGLDHLRHPGPVTEAAGPHLDRLGNQLGKAVDSFNMTVSSMDTRVGVTARKLHDLEIFDGEVPEVQRVDAWPRRSTLAERAVADGPVDEAS